VSLTVNSSTIYARRYDVTRGAASFYVDLDLRALWREIPNAGTYTVTDQSNQNRRLTGAWAQANGVAGAQVLSFFTSLLDNALGGSQTLGVNGQQDYAIEHACTYNAGTPSEGSYLIRLDTLRGRRLIIDGAGNSIDSGAWGVNALNGAQVQAFFEQLIHAATGVAPV